MSANVTLFTNFMLDTLRRLFPRWYMYLFSGGPRTAFPSLFTLPYSQISYVILYAAFSQDGAGHLCPISKYFHVLYSLWQRFKVPKMVQSFLGVILYYTFCYFGDHYTTLLWSYEPTLCLLLIYGESGSEIRIQASFFRASLYLAP